MSNEQCPTCGNEMESWLGRGWYCTKCGTTKHYVHCDGTWFIHVPEFMRWKNFKEEPAETERNIIACSRGMEENEYYYDFACYNEYSGDWKRDSYDCPIIWYREIGPMPQKKEKQ